ncbi:hypothetical protein ACIQTZ_12395 [Paenarthrobacter sp. NPDC090520]|uniref:hypothetical protein n=1 Tax=Paenarthrobacter sp. NPDC090520 TaxID=3364382 RepID=UPI0038247917
MLIGELLQASDASTVRLDAASLKDEENVHVKYVWVIPLKDTGQSYISMGTLEDSQTARELWSIKQPLKDYQVPAKSAVNVVFEIDIVDPRKEASTAGMTVKYSDDSTTFATEGKMGYTFPTSTCLSNQ